MSRYTKKSGNLDINHKQVENYLTRFGWEVHDVSNVNSFVDIIAIKDHTVLVEVKDPNGKIYLSQIKLAAETRGNICFIQGLSDVKELNRNPLQACLSLKRKAELMKFYRNFMAKTKAKRPSVAVSTIEKKIGKL